MKSALLRSSRLAASTLLASFAFGFCSEVNAQSRIDLPAGGWRTSMDSRTGFVQEVNYPASSVNSDGKAAPALIRGHIQQRIEQAIQRQVGGSAKPDNSHGRQPTTLVANGVAMPLAVVQTGAFNRPYAFGSGSNSIEMPARGVYHVYVNYYGAGELQDALTIAEVTVVTQEGSLHEKRQVFRVPLRRPGELMLVRSFVY